VLLLEHPQLDSCPDDDVNCWENAVAAERSRWVWDVAGVLGTVRIRQVSLVYILECLNSNCSVWLLVYPAPPAAGMKQVQAF